MSRTFLEALSSVGKNLHNEITELNESIAKTKLPYKVVPNLYWTEDNLTNYSSRLKMYCDKCNAIGIKSVSVNVTITYDSTSQTFSYLIPELIPTLKSTLNSADITIDSVKFSIIWSDSLTLDLDTPAVVTALQTKMLDTLALLGPIDYVVVFNERPQIYAASADEYLRNAAITILDGITAEGYNVVNAYATITDFIKSDTTIASKLWKVGINQYPSLYFAETEITEEEAIHGLTDDFNLENIFRSIKRITGGNDFILTETGMPDYWEALPDPIALENAIIAGTFTGTSSGGGAPYLFFKAFFENTKYVTCLYRVCPWWYHGWDDTKMSKLFSDYCSKEEI